MKKCIKSIVTAAVVLVVPMQDVFAQIEEVLVTSRKAKESINDVPLAVSAFNSEDFEKRNIESLADVANYTPGLSFENYSGGITPAPVIRGLSQTALQNRIQNVSFFIDGVYIQQAGNIDFGLLGVDRIEVVKGPQSALYGRNSFAGAINYITAKGTEEFEGYISATYGTDDREDVKFSVSGPIIPSVLRGRLTAGKSEFDGTWENRFATTEVSTGRAIGNSAVDFLGGNGTDGNLGGYDNKAVSVALDFTPTDDLSINLGYYNIDVRREDGATGTLEQTTDSNDVGALNCSPNDSGANTLYCGTVSYDPKDIARDPRNIGNYADSKVLTFDLVYQLTEKLQIHSLFGRTVLDAESFGIGEGSTGVVGTGVVSVAAQPITELQAKSEELRLEYTDTNLRAMLGAYLSNVEDSNQFDIYRAQTLASGGELSNNGSILFSPDDQLFADDVRSVFGLVEYDINSELSLYVEARQTEEEKKLTDNQDDENTRSGVFKYFTPRVTLNWQADDDSLYYISYAEGIKSGGFNGATADPGFEDFDEESNTTIELGSKLTLLDGNLQINTAIYQVEWDDLQISFADVVPVDPLNFNRLESSYIGNASGAESIGIEVDGIWLVNDKWSVNFAFSKAKAEFDSGVTFSSISDTCLPTLCDLVVVEVAPGIEAVSADIGGNQLPRTPETQISIGAEFQEQLWNTGWTYTARADFSYQDEQQASPLNLAVIEDRKLVNTSFTLTDPNQKWSVNLWTKNLFNEEYIANSFVTGFPRRYITAFGDSRTIGLTGKYSF